MYTREDIERMVDEEDVEFIRLQFTDIFGVFKNVAVTRSQLDRVLDGKCSFDGSSIEGFARIEESDMCLKPDLDTFVIFPWRPQQGKVARLICDIVRPDGTPFDGDVRYALKKVLKEAADKGYMIEVGPELEFFLFNLDEEGQPTTYSTEKAGYFDIGPMDQGENARRDMVMTLEDMGFEIQASHHEIAPAQHEIDFKYDEALITADNIMTFKMAVKTIAKRHGLHATFMPKPKSGVTGSGMHLNISVRKNGENCFYDGEDENGLSKTAYYFIGGVMKHVKALCAVTNPLVNSYKRLVPGYEAPVYIAWSTGNRSPLIRIPSAGGNEKRIELRFPDPSANPYLALAAIIKAGLWGIENEVMPPERIDKNLYAMTKEEREALGVEDLCGSLGRAIYELNNDELIKDVLGEFIFNKYYEEKNREFMEYRTHVSQWELREYLAKN